MVNLVKTLWHTYQMKIRKKNLLFDLEDLEYTLNQKQLWVSNIDTLIKVLEVIDDKVLENGSLENLSEFFCYTGFQNSKHVVDTLTVVQSNLQQNILLSNEVNGIIYDRKNINLQKFFISNDKLNITIVDFKRILLYRLKEIKIEADRIADPRIKYREYSIINGIVRDLFSIVESIIKWGVSDE